MKFFPYVFKSLFRKKTRSLLTLGSILLPLFVVCLMGTLIRTLDRPPTGAGMYRIVVRHKVSLSNWIPEAYRARIQTLPGVEDMSIWCWFGGKYVDYAPKNFFARFGVEPAKLLKVFDEAKIVEGSAADWIADRSGAMVGTDLVKKFGWKLGQKVVLQGDIYPVNLELTIRAIYDAAGGNNAALFFNWAYVEEALPQVKGRIGTFYIRAKDAEAVARLPKQIDALFENTDAPTKTETEKEFQNGFVQMLGNVKLMLNGISAAIVFVILLIAANTMSMAARERVNEIAVLRTLGFPKGDDPRDDRRREPSPRAPRRRARPRPLRPRVRRLQGRAHEHPDVGLRDGHAALPVGPRRGLRDRRLHRPRRGDRPGRRRRAALDHGRAEAGRLMKFLPLVLKNLLRKKTRSGLTIGSILLPFFVICLLGTFVAMLDADPSQGRGMFRIAVRHRVSFTNFLPASHLQKIRQLPGVKAAMPFNWFGGRYVDFSAFNVFERFAVDPAVFFDVFDADGVVEGIGRGVEGRPERPPRGRAPDEEIRLEARAADHAHGRHLARRLHVHDPRRLPRQRRGGRLLRPEGHRRDAARARAGSTR